MKFDQKHLMYALAIGIAYFVVAMVCGWLGSIGMFIWAIVFFTLFVGGMIYAFKDVKGYMEGIMTGLVYVVVFAGLYIVAVLIGITAILPYFEPITAMASLFGAAFGGSALKVIFGWPGIWLPSIALLVFTAALGWLNENK